MVLTSNKNHKIITENVDSLQLSVKNHNGVLKIKSKCFTDKHLQKCLIQDLGIGSITEKDAVLV